MAQKNQIYSNLGFCFMYIHIYLQTFNWKTAQSHKKISFIYTYIRIYIQTSSILRLKDQLNSYILGDGYRFFFKTHLYTYIFITRSPENNTVTQKRSFIYTYIRIYIQASSILQLKDQLNSYILGGWLSVFSLKHTYIHIYS